MIQLLVRLEYRRRALRRRVLGCLGISEDRYFVLAAVLVFLYVMLFPIVGISYPFVGIPFWAIVGGTVLLGLFLIIIPPVSLILF